MKLDDLQPDAAVRGILSDAVVTVVSLEWHGSNALTLVYRGPNGRVADEILYRHDEPRLEIVRGGRPWSFDGDGRRPAAAVAPAGPCRRCDCWDDLRRHYRRVVTVVLVVPAAAFPEFPAQEEA